MYCARCGTQIPDDSEFCYSCGAQIVGVEREKRRSAAESGETIPQPVAPTPAPQAARPAPRTVGAATLAQPYVGIAVIAGAALAAIGCFVAWYDYHGYTATGFDFGFVTNSNGGDGKDGMLILPIAVVAAVLGALHFKARNSLASLAVIALGAAIVGIAGYNLWKVFDAADSLKYVGIGLYIIIAGGLVTALAGLLGPRMSPS
jgi:membrane-associated protease RseP (regulator of RpoE activity)